MISYIESTNSRPALFQLFSSFTPAQSHQNLLFDALYHNSWVSESEWKVMPDAIRRNEAKETSAFSFWQVDTGDRIKGKFPLLFQVHLCKYQKDSSVFWSWSWLISYLVSFMTKRTSTIHQYNEAREILCKQLRSAAEASWSVCPESNQHRGTLQEELSRKQEQTANTRKTSCLRQHQAVIYPPPS